MEMLTAALPSLANIGIAKNSPPPKSALKLIQQRDFLTATPELPSVPRPAIVVGGIPCERFASACLSQPDVAYIAVVESEDDAAPYEGWVDAVVVAPSAPEEICKAGARALGRKVKRGSEPRPIVGRTTFAWRGMSAELSLLEARLMRRLVLARGAVVGKDELAYQLWGTYTCDPGRAVDTHIYRIRKRIADIPGAEILTERRRGFRLTLDPSVPYDWPTE